MESGPTDVDGLIDHLFRSEYGKLVAYLTSVFRFENLEVAEDIVQDTLLTAFRHWSFGEVPERPGAWLMTVARNKALNVVERDRRVTDALHRYALEHRQTAEELLVDPAGSTPRALEDSQLGMIFACCHPTISTENQIALVLKTLGGFSQAEVARALLIGEEAAAKRIYRAKQDIRNRKIRLEVPDGEERTARLEAVYTCIYLLYNEGYNSTESDDLIRRDLCFEAMRLGKLLLHRFAEDTRISALMALMCFHSARFDSRTTDGGEGIPFDEQDRSRWDARLIRAGQVHLSNSARGDTLTGYHLEASIVAQYCLAPSAEETDWAFIHRLYERLYELKPSPLILLNLAVVSSRLHGVESAVHQLESVREDRRLMRYPLFHATLGDFYQRLGRTEDARSAYRQALTVTASDREAAFIERKLNALES